MRRRAGRGRLIPVVVFVFAAGTVTGWMLREPAVRDMLARRGDRTPTVGTSGLSADANRASDNRDDVTPASAMATGRATGETASAPVADPGATVSSRDPIDVLRAKDLRLPIDDADVKAMQGQFGDRRDGGARGHEAVDILAPRGTPVHAVENGTIARLFLSKLGGITVYQFEPTGRFCDYYAHLERYAEGLREGQPNARGPVIGYVGTSGNAPPDTPHLHFAIFELTPEKHWWEGTPLDPWAAFNR
jgi:murein DD-endopeptidase MepM/ murein hydrolase activator NlpD